MSKSGYFIPHVEIRLLSIFEIRLFSMFKSGSFPCLNAVIFRAALKSGFFLGPISGFSACLDPAHRRA